MKNGFVPRPWALLVVIGAIFWAAVPAAEAASVRLTPVSIQNRHYYRLSNVAQYFGLKHAASASRTELTGTGGRKLVFYPDKRYASIDGVQVTLDYAMVWQKNVGYISVSDFNNLVNPVLNNKALKGKRPKIIVIDPGHGGNDQGASGKRGSEKWLTLTIAKKLEASLKKMGYTVYMTRTGDQAVALKRRAEIARGRKADLFISIHMNATGNATVTGIETFALTPTGAPSSADSTGKSTAYKGSPMVGNSAALAYSVQRELVQRLKPKDRGVKRARFVVLTENTCPSILVECGFISNTAEENRLRDAAHQDKVVQSIANGVDRYCKRLPR